MAIALCAMFCLITCVYVRYHIPQVDDEVYRLKDRFHNLCNDAPWKSLSRPDEMWLEVVEGKVDGHSTRIDTLQARIENLEKDANLYEEPDPCQCGCHGSDKGVVMLDGEPCCDCWVKK